MLYTGILILINIPSVFLILDIQKDIENTVFVKLTNQSGLDFSDITLQGKFQNLRIGNINSGSSNVFNYDPPYMTNDARLYQKPDNLFLIVTHSGTLDTIRFPTLRMRDCKHLTIDKNLKIVDQ